MKELLKVLEFTADRTQALADSQSVAGEPLHIGDVTLVPVSSISCGFAGGGKRRDRYTYSGHVRHRVRRCAGHR